MKFLICWNSLAQTWRNSSCHNKWIKNVWYLAYLFTFGKSISVLIFVLIIFYVVTDIGKLWESDYFGFSENTCISFSTFICTNVFQESFSYKTHLEQYFYYVITYFTNFWCYACFLFPPWSSQISNALLLYSHSLSSRLGYSYDLTDSPHVRSIGNFFFAGARIFFDSLDAAIFLFSRVSDIPTESLILPVISTNDRLTLGCELWVWLSV